MNWTESNVCYKSTLAWSTGLIPPLLGSQGIAGTVGRIRIRIRVRVGGEVLREAGERSGYREGIAGHKIHHIAGIDGR